MARVFATALDTRSHAQAQGPGNLIGEDMIATSFVASSDYPACTAAVTTAFPDQRRSLSRFF